jgi:hypothetical protein
MAPTASSAPAAYSPARTESKSEAQASKSQAPNSSSAAGVNSGEGLYSATAAKPAMETGAESSDQSAPAAIGKASADLSEIEQIKSALEKRRKMFLVTAIEGAHRTGLEGDELSLEFAADTKHLRDTLSKSENVKILREVCKEVTGRDLGVRFAIGDGETGVVPVSKEETERREKLLEKKTLRETAEKDPVVQQMLRTFRGEIVDVKRVDPAK